MADRALHQRCVSDLMSCSKNIVDHLDDKNKSAEIKKLEKIMAEYCKYDNYHKVLETHVNLIEKFSEDHFKTGEGDGMPEFFKLLDAEAKKLKTPKIHPLMEAFKTATSSASADGDNLNDSDIITTQVTQQTIDPFTKRPLVNPVKNKICGHIYEKSSVDELLKQNSRLRCPIVGCGNREKITQNSFS